MDAIETEYNALRRFVKQLDIIDCDYNDKIEAISDYLRACVNRSLWAEKGFVPYNFFDNYEDDLRRVWKDEKELIEIVHENFEDVKKGKLLYSKCKTKNIPLNSLSVPLFFVPGCYHVLSDEMIIGWHPEFKQKLEEDSKDE